MKLISATPRHALTMALGSFLLFVLMDNAGANQAYSNNQAAEKPGFFERASENIGGFFHRLFNKDDVPPPPKQQQKNTHDQRAHHGTTTRPGGNGYSLDTPPSGVTPTSPKGSLSKAGTGTSKTPTEKHVSGETGEPKTTKSKTTNTTTDKKEVAVKNNPSPQKPAKETKPPQHTVTDTTTHTEPNTHGKTDTTTEPKVGQEQNVLTGGKTSKAGRVKSPYPPYNELDVSGLSTGSLALDPTTQKVFRVP